MSSKRGFSTNTASLHGIRTIFCFFVVAFHTFFLSTLTLDDPSEALALITGGTSAHTLAFISTLGTGAVDIFLLLSGFLLKASLPRVTTYTALRYSVFRYLRLAPAYITVAYAWRLLGNTKCITLSEALLLNWMPTQQRCIIPGWSTSVDFLSHILLLPLLPYPIILYSIIILTPPFRAWTWLKLRKPYYTAPIMPVDYFSSAEELEPFSNLGISIGNFNFSDPVLSTRRDRAAAYGTLYFSTTYRIAAVVVGVLLYNCMREKNVIYRTVRRFPALSLFCMTLVWGLFHVVEQCFVMHPWALLIHHSANRMLITMATSVVIILTCAIDNDLAQDRISRYLRALLSCELFQFLQRFSYVVYLLHIPVAFILTGIPPRLTQERVTAVWIIVMALKWYFCTIAIGLPFWCLEFVLLRARQWLFTRLPGIGNDIAARQKIA